MYRPVSEQYCGNAITSVSIKQRQKKILCSSSNSTEAGNISSTPMQLAQIAVEVVASHQSAGCQH